MGSTDGHGQAAINAGKQIREDMPLLEKFSRIFELPPAMEKHVAFVANQQEMELVVGLNDRVLTLDEAAALLGMPVEEAEPFLEQAYFKQLIFRQIEEDGGKTYSAGTFYYRLNPLSMFENWGDVPAEARDAVLDWQLDEFIAKWQPVIDEIIKDPDAFHDIPNRDYLLLDEVLEMIDAAEEWTVAPCDCRSLVMACSRPVETCIRFDDGGRQTLDAGHGRRITKEECKQIVIEADRSGLMHTGRRDWQEHGVGFGMCNCCACDCYPIRAGKKLDMVGEWPRSHHVARRDEERCIQCGTCAERCHFEAFYIDAFGLVDFNEENCVGCGICATACTEEAITMVPLAGG